MKKIKLFIYLIVLSNLWFANSQVTDQNDTTEFNFPLEKIYLHINNSTLFVGESLLYKAYVTNKQSQLSEFSKVAYIKLLDKENSLVFKQKVKLKNGQGSGDFLIPTDLTTGSYKLIAFTKLGLKQISDNAFVTDINIINPYIPLDTDLVSIIDSLPAAPKDSSNSEVESAVEINLTQDTLNKRQRVSIGLNVTDTTNYGNYSISVKKIDPLQLNHSISILKLNDYQRTIKVKNKEQFMPEIRGELFTGKLISTDNKATIENQNVALSIPDKDFVLKIGTTDEQGRFYLNINKSYSSNSGFLQVLNKYSDSYKFDIAQEPILDLSLFSYHKLTVYKGFEERILERSIKNQIENSYSSVKQNSLKEKKSVPFFGNRGVKYKLDNYTRFPTLNETFIEIIKGVTFNKNEEGYDIEVRAIDDFLRSPYKAMVLVDGLLIQNHTDLYNFSAFDITSINIINDKYFYGGQVFQGIVSIITKENDYLKQVKLSFVNPIELFTPELEKDYYKVDYSETEKFKHIPDYRTQLFWNPDLKISSTETKIDFFTSDESGVFEIIIEGINNYGQTMRSTKLFKVN